MMKAPFPWFGGKSRAAPLVWKYFGDVPNYVEPFAGSLAVLLGRPTPAQIETVNDSDCFLANFWRALKYDPEGVALHADWPVNGADLHARHRWLVGQKDFWEKMRADPDFYDVKIAGWWVWGICSWIGSGWCSALANKRPHLTGAGMGVHRSTLCNWVPHLGDAGRGVNRKSQDLSAYFEALAERLRKVRVCCGDWKRVLGHSPTTKLGTTGVFLDPPYGVGRGMVYAEDSLSVSAEVRAWAIENGENPRLRIALCGYVGEHAMPVDWIEEEWLPSGGYSVQGGEGSRGKENRKKERIWFSPHCLQQFRSAYLF